MEPATIRVYVLTYRRPHLLRRALQSLLDQTYTKWVCEVHNDDPNDEAPQRIVNELTHKDPRFEYHHHQENWGAIASFNYAFTGGREPYASILEDDNWWEPDFLETALNTLHRFPDAAMTWSNMRIWRERPDGTWEDSGETVWRSSTIQPIEFSPPEILQAFDALHSQGAMLFKPDKFEPRTVPETTPLAIVEPMRERAARGSLILIPQRHANFAVTQNTARDSDRVRWMQSKLIVAASFFQSVECDPALLDRMLDARRQLRPSDSDIILHLGLTLWRWQLCRYATFRDWVRVILSVFRHPVTLWRGHRFRAEQRQTWNWAVEQSRAWHTPARGTVLTKR